MSNNLERFECSKFIIFWLLVFAFTIWLLIGLFKVTAAIGAAFIGILCG